MTTLEQLNLSQPLTDVYTAMETDLMLAIARQLAAGGEINATSEWRLKKLAEAGALSKETVRIIASYTGIQSDLITEAIEGAAMGVADRLEPALQACARDGYISATDGTPISESMKNVVTNFRSQAKTDLNLVNTVMQYKAKSSYTTLVNKIYDETKRQELLGVLGKHTLEVASGGESRQTAVRNCIKEFSQKGIPAFVDKRGREWSPEAYINMDIRTTVHNTAHAAQDACCDKYGMDLIQISSHMGARPKCAIDQGKLYSRSNRSGIAHDGDGSEIPFYPWSSTSYGQPDGILGINCHHHKYPFADGVNFQRYFPYEQDENAERYKEFQKQRAMERRVRATSRQADMLEAAGDTVGAKEARRKLREQRKAYRDYSKEHGLAVHNDRLTVVKVKNEDSSYKNIYSSGLTENGGGGIIKTKKYDFLSGVLGVENISELEAKALDETVSVIPQNHLSVIEKTVQKVDVVPNRGYCSYDATNKKIILDPDKMNGSIIHEYGHVLADAYNLYEDDEFLQILKSKFDSLNWGETVYAKHPNENGYVFFLKSDKLMNEYQGRIYADFIDIDYSASIPLKSFQEYFSVGFDTYFKNPNLLKNKDPELFKYIERMLKNE